MLVSRTSASDFFLTYRCFSFSLSPRQFSRIPSACGEDDLCRGDSNWFASSPRCVRVRERASLLTQRYSRRLASFSKPPRNTTLFAPLHFSCLSQKKSILPRVRDVVRFTRATRQILRNTCPADPERTRVSMSTRDAARGSGGVGVTRRKKIVAQSMVFLRFTSKRSPLPLPKNNTHCTTG